MFGIGADRIHDDFKIKSVAFSVVAPVSPVPLRAAGLLLLGALAGATALRRCKTA
ncbi:hypothetical protein [Loktanella atrilutea]|uniref:hypothetical protein n=1 Tax=Loktanella atrilutea TaxID=366533 RepID=UPI0015B5BB26|nr:hypothetical protein [Loktanella atrilutea]